jgi:hypothetical protein
MFIKSTLPTLWLRRKPSCSRGAKGEEGMLVTTLGWALVAVAVAIALVPVLYGVHLGIVEEKIRHHRAAQVVAMPVETATHCPSCGEHVSVSELLYETPMTESVSVAS